MYSLKLLLKQYFIFLEKGSLLSRLFRRSGRNKARQLETYSAQFPPAEWFNSKAVHLHSVGTQTQDHVSKYKLIKAIRYLLIFCNYAGYADHTHPFKFHFL